MTNEGPYLMKRACQHCKRILGPDVPTTAEQHGTTSHGNCLKCCLLCGTQNKAIEEVYCLFCLEKLHAHNVPPRGQEEIEERQKLEAQSG